MRLATIGAIVVCFLAVYGAGVHADMSNVFRQGNVVPETGGHAALILMGGTPAFLAEVGTVSRDWPYRVGVGGHNGAYVVYGRVLTSKREAFRVRIPPAPVATATMQVDGIAGLRIEDGKRRFFGQFRPHLQIPAVGSLSNAAVKIGWRSLGMSVRRVVHTDRFTAHITVVLDDVLTGTETLRVETDISYWWNATDGIGFRAGWFRLGSGSPVFSLTLSYTSRL